MARRGHSTTSTWPVCGCDILIWKQSGPSGLSGGPSGMGALLSSTVSSPACICSTSWATQNLSQVRWYHEGVVPSLQTKPAGSTPNA